MIHLPQYTRKDLLIFSGMMPVMIVVLNAVMFDKRYFTEWYVFIGSSLIMTVLISILWMGLTWIAVTLRDRFPLHEQMMKRLSIAIFLFIVSTALLITLMFWGYDHFRLFGYRMNEARYEWTILAGMVFNITITFIHEGADGFDKWKLTLRETSQLKKEYMQSRLLGLKSQVNPHFLFNCFNTLSSLIHENREQAEEFLDELSKVYRYLLRGTDERFVSLDTELQFTNSYFRLLKARYGEAIRMEVNVTAGAGEQVLPPLTLQMIPENTYQSNVMSRDQPLTIQITSLPNGWLEIRNNLAPKLGGSTEETDAGIDNVLNKYKLLCHREIVIAATETERVVLLPLINEDSLRR
ncbi:histidine kinase [Chitinophaga sedimenti]|uniref:sensor histidine kinase n=1 Tax=Chitinophaga sedimenti TaxID=2033606 RepID=UPI0020058290|nr:histidine kinase [Chitinophaga sedimenti]MCK7558341.1 histidine kinase [Chitinophaga sedimenti]